MHLFGRVPAVFKVVESVSATFRMVGSVPAIGFMLVWGVPVRARE